MRNTSQKIETESPLISVLVPVYNCREWLDNCIGSIIGQDYRPIQIVLGNDGSTDNSLEICRRYAEENDFIEVLDGPNQGVSSARNRLLESIRGDYFLFVDADDWIEPDMLSFLLRKATETGADAVTCNWVVNDAPCPPEYREESWDRPTAVKKFLFHKELSGSLCNKLIKTSLFHKDRFRNDIWYGEDALFFWQLLQRAERIHFTDRKLYHYRRNAESLSRKPWTPERKGSGHLVWQEICDNVAQWWPGYSSIAGCRFGMEDMWALYFASLCGYPYDRHIRERQMNIRRHLKDIRKYKPDGFIKYIVAVMLAYWYGGGSILRRLKK